MPADPNSSVSGVLIVGGRTEPFLGACLESLADAIDLLVVNDNGNDPENRRILESSRLFSENKLEVIESEFRGFSYCRNLCLDHLRDRLPQGSWVLYVDSDEVHPTSLGAVTRRVLPNLASSTGVVDGYFCNFFQSPRYFISLDRRHNMLFRLYDDTRWDGDVHERLVGIHGERIALPYRYYHYGYLSPAIEIADKWRLYGSLGDNTSAGQAEDAEAIPRGVARRVMRFRGRHPAAVSDLLSAESEWVKDFERMARSRGADGVLKRISSAKCEARMAWRAVQFAFRSGRNREMRAALREIAARRGIIP